MAERALEARQSSEYKQALEEQRRVSSPVTSDEYEV
jgi:hypothetical protein